MTRALNYLHDVTRSLMSVAAQEKTKPLVFNRLIIGSSLGNWWRCEGSLLAALLLGIGAYMQMQRLTATISGTWPWCSRQGPSKCSAQRPKIRGITAVLALARSITLAWCISWRDDRSVRLIRAHVTREMMRALSSQCNARPLSWLLSQYISLKNLFSSQLLARQSSFFNYKLLQKCRRWRHRGFHAFTKYRIAAFLSVVIFDGHHWDNDRRAAAAIH